MPKTITLSDGSVWEYREYGNSSKLFWANDADDRGCDEPSLREDKPLTADDHRKIADVLAPAVREALDVPEWRAILQKLGGIAHDQSNEIASECVQLPDGQNENGSAWLGVDIFRAIIREAAAPPERERLPTAERGGDSDRLDAERWRALFKVGGRVRVLGSAGLHSESSRQHIGLELWTEYRDEDMKPDTSDREELTLYADKARTADHARQEEP